MSKPEFSASKLFRAFLVGALLAAIIYLIVRNIGTFGNVLLVMIGFGAVVLVHEFGHFVAAKLSGIKVEAFSIGFPPTLLGIQMTEQGCRFRVLPGSPSVKEEDDKEKDKEDNDNEEKDNDEKADDTGAESEQGLLSFTIGGPGRPRDTEYRVGLIPFGGYVKMLGQEDVGLVKSSDDPRSYANKPVGSRAAVIAAGVVFNIISAVVIFMIVFLVGIKLTPPVVGGVSPDSPAARAGLKVGDEIIEIAGKSKDLDFGNIGMAAALSDANEAVELKVRRGNEELDFAIVAKEQDTPYGKMKLFGIDLPLSLIIAKPSSEAGVNALLTRTGLSPGDQITEVNGEKVERHWELVEIVRNALVPEVTLTAERDDGNDVPSRVGLRMLFAGGYEIESESELYHIYSMVPRLRVTAVVAVPVKAEGGRVGRAWNKLAGLFGKADTTQADTVTRPGLKKGDIILEIGEIENPTYREMRKVVEENEDKDVSIKVLRADANGFERPVPVSVVPRRIPDSEWVQIGAALALDAEHPVVAKTINAEGGPSKLGIPRGAVVTAVDGVRVLNYYDVIRKIRKYSPGERITIDWRVDEETAGAVALNVVGGGESITVKSTFAEDVPFEILQKLYKAGGPFDAVAMGCRKTIMFITQTYVTLNRLVRGLVGRKSLMGPVGIIRLSYRIVAEQPFIYYVYFLGLISAIIAVFNFLPLPPLDGGLMVLLIVEKVKGSALSERTQGAIAYLGWGLIAIIFLVVTYNDISNIVSSFFN